MTEFEIQVFADAGEFAADWQTLGYSATDTDQYWALLGELAPDELLFHLPEWLADEKVGFVDGATPTAFVGSIDTESEQAIRVTYSAAARPLSRIASRIRPLEESITRLQSDPDSDPDRVAWLRRRLTEKRDALDTREDVPTLSDEWLPKSQIEFIGRRSPG